ncbi:MAG TPA: DUF6247 family protein [Pseudonocardiaceae bacterium]|jgi:hypothetical protein|nr:DUF6247 family protein [Pseudonocardiaceae bacterium]
MTVAPARKSTPFAEMSPADIRAGLVPEEQLEFDQAWRAACLQAAETMDLTIVRSTLEIYGRHAVLVKNRGVDGYRELMARVEERLRTGAEPTGGMSADEVRALIQERLGR